MKQFYSQLIKLVLTKDGYQANLINHNKLKFSVFVDPSSFSPDLYFVGSYLFLIKKSIIAAATQRNFIIILHLMCMLPHLD